MTRDMALFYVKGLIVNFMFCTTCTYGILKFFFLIAQSKIIFFLQLKIVEKVVTYKKN